MKNNYNKNFFFFSVLEKKVSNMVRKREETESSMRTVQHIPLRDKRQNGRRDQQLPG